MQICFFLGRLIDFCVPFPFWGSYGNLRDGRHAVLRVSIVVNSSTVFRVPGFKKETGRTQRGRLCFRMKRW